MLEILGFTEMSETIKLLRTKYLKGLKKHGQFSLSDIITFEETEHCLTFFRKVVKDRFSKI